MYREHIEILPRFIQKAIYGNDLSRLNIPLNTTQTRILMFINNDNTRTMSEISRMIGLDKSSFTRSVDSLVHTGYVSKKTQPHDRRTIRLELTAKGIKAACMIENDFDRYFSTLIESFAENEKAEFLGALKTFSRYAHRIMDREE